MMSWCFQAPISSTVSNITITYSVFYLFSFTLSIYTSSFFMGIRRTFGTVVKLRTCSESGRHLFCSVWRRRFHNFTIFSWYFSVEKSKQSRAKASIDDIFWVKCNVLILNNVMVFHLKILQYILPRQRFGEGVGCMLLWRIWPRRSPTIFTVSLSFVCQYCVQSFGWFSQTSAYKT